MGRYEIVPNATRFVCSGNAAYGIVRVRDTEDPAHPEYDARVDANWADGTEPPRIILPNGTSVNIDDAFLGAYQRLARGEGARSPSQQQACSEMEAAGRSATAAPATPAAPTAPSSPISGSLRAGFRMTGGATYSYGFQVHGGAGFRVNPYFRIALQLEMNNQFLGSDKPTSTLSRDAVLGSNFPGVRNSRTDGATYTDVTGGTAVSNQTYFMEIVPEVQAMVRPVPSFPFEFGFRLGFGITYTNLHTRTTVTQAAPNSGPGSNGCLPGDIHCGDAPIPETPAGPGYGPYESDADTWFTWARFGPRIAFPINDYFQTGTEFLFRSNAAGGFDEFWRTNIRLGLPLGANFLIFLEPRYVMSLPQGKPMAHGFDGVAGVMGRW